MRLREVGTGVVVSVDDARAAEMVGTVWERVDSAPKDSPKKPRRKQE